MCPRTWRYKVLFDLYFDRCLLKDGSFHIYRVPALCAPEPALGAREQNLPFKAAAGVALFHPDYVAFFVIVKEKLAGHVMFSRM